MMQRVLAVLLISALVGCPNWQASGNMTDYLPTIYGWLNSIFTAPVTQTVATTISDLANAEWDRFWNVAVFQVSDKDCDAVLCGYSFRAHWYWHNNFQGKGFSIVIWKDYKCTVEAEYKKNTPPDISEDNSAYGDVLTTIFTGNPMNIDDIWQANCQAIEGARMGFLSTMFAGGDPTKMDTSGVMMPCGFILASVKICVHSGGVMTGYKTNVASSGKDVFAFTYVTRVDS